VPAEAQVQLRFHLHPALRSSHGGRTSGGGPLLAWRKLQACFAYFGDYYSNRSALVARWLERCELASNQSLSLLDRIEGVLGGNDNAVHKQLRRANCVEEPFELRFSAFDARAGDAWTCEELLDLVRAFEVLCKDVVHPDDPVSGEICIR
jgi:hypothetical protein